MRNLEGESDRGPTIGMPTRFAMVHRLHLRVHMARWNRIVCHSLLSRHW